MSVPKCLCILSLFPHFVFELYPSLYSKRTRNLYLKRIHIHDRERIVDLVIRAGP